MTKPSPKLHWDVLLVNRNTKLVEHIFYRRYKLPRAEHYALVWSVRLSAGHCVRLAPFEMYNQEDVYDEEAVMAKIRTHDGKSQSQMKWIKVDW